MIQEIVVKESAKHIFKYAVEFFKKNAGKLLIKENDIYESLNAHVQKIKNWSSEITFKDLQSAKSIQNNYIDLDMFVYPRKIRIDETEQVLKIPINKIFDYEKRHLVILGQPGAGKTTSMKHLCQSIFYEEDKFGKFKYPLVVKLRDYNLPITDKYSAGLVIEAIYNIFGLSTEIKNNQNEIEVIRTKEKIVLYLLDKLNVLLIVDGFDELSFKKHREIVINEILEISSYLENSRLLVTSRTSDFPYSIENITSYELCPLNQEQIKDFAKKWLVENAKVESFLKEISNSPYIDTAVRPLTIAHLCAIYERVGKIPDKPKTIYRKIINLLLEEWDEQRNVKRVSKYSGFEIDRKFEFLNSIAYYLTVSSRKSIFTLNALESAYFKIYEDFDLEKKDSKNVMEELESHTGLFLQAGYNLYEFAHKSLQEYLTAEYIVRLPKIPTTNQIISSIPNELAIAVSISSNPSLYFVEVVNNIFSKLNLNFQFYQTFLNRLIIEKPEFNKTNSVGIAAFQLYSTYLLKNKDLDQLQLFVKDDLVVEFEGLIRSIFKRNATDIFSKYYDFSSEEVSANGFSIITLSKKKKSEIVKPYADIKFLDLPTKLVCRETFF